jgi:prevent-host-death family protein
MNSIVSITRAKARLSGIISRLIQIKETVIITKKGKNVAVLMPFEAYQDLKKDESRGLLAARGALAGQDEEIDRLCDSVYSERDKARSRKVEL